MPTVRAIAGSFIPGPLGNTIGGIAENIAESSLRDQFRGNETPAGKTVTEVVAGIHDSFNGLFYNGRQTRYFRPLPVCCHFARNVPLIPLLGIGELLNKIKAQQAEAQISEIAGEIATIQGVIPSLQAFVEILLKSERFEDRIQGQQIHVRVMRLVQLLSTLYDQQSSLRVLAASFVR